MRGRLADLGLATLAILGATPGMIALADYFSRF